MTLARNLAYIAAGWLTLSALAAAAFAAAAMRPRKSLEQQGRVPDPLRHFAKH